MPTLDTAGAVAPHSALPLHPGPLRLHRGAGGTTSTSLGEADGPDLPSACVSTPPSQLHPLALLWAWRRSAGRKGKPVPPLARDPTAHAPAGVCHPNGESLSPCRGPEPAGCPSLLHRTPRPTPLGSRLRAALLLPACPAPAQEPGEQLPAPQKEHGGQLAMPGLRGLQPPADEWKVWTSTSVPRPVLQTMTGSTAPHAADLRHVSEQTLNKPKESMETGSRAPPGHASGSPGWVAVFVAVVGFTLVLGPGWAYTLFVLH